MTNVKQYTQKYIDWVIKLGKVRFTLLGFLILAIFAVFTHILLSFLIVGEIHWESLGYAIAFGLISAPFVIYFFTVLVERLELSRQALAQSIQDKSALLATISHELRTPLNGILGLSRMLLDTQLTEQQRNYLNTISVSAVSLGHIFNDIIDFEKINGRKIDLYKTETDFHAFLSDIYNVANLMCSQKRLKFQLISQENLPHFLMLDGTRLSQVLWNLINNAVKFTDEGTVTLEVKRLSELKYEFRVKDTGQGIPQDELTKIFKMYYQVEGNHKKSAGSGIGLAISKHIALLMNGNLVAESVLGQGAEFILTIDAEETHQPMNVSPESAVKNLKILLVEDVQLNIVVVKATLEKLGHQVDVAMTGAQAISAFEQNDYDLVLLDIQLPDMTGFDVAQHLRQGYENDRYDYLPPLVALTANVMHSKAEYLSQGMDDVLRKPLEVKELIRCLSEHFSDDFQEKTAVDFLPVFDDGIDDEIIDHQFIAELVELIGVELYKNNLAMFRQAIVQNELDLTLPYQAYLAEPNNPNLKAKLTAVAHKLKGAAGSLGMKKLQELANYIQQGDEPEWESSLEQWMAEWADLLEHSIQALEDDLKQYS